MVSLSIKPGDQTNETESPNLISKAELTGEVPKLFFFLYLMCSEKFQMEGETN